MIVEIKTTIIIATKFTQTIVSNLYNLPTSPSPSNTSTEVCVVQEI